MDVKTLRHNAALRVAGTRWSKQRVVTLSGYGARYHDYDGPEGMVKYAEHAERNRVGGNGVEHGRHNGVVWLSAEPSVIAAVKLPEPTPVEVEVGEVVYIESATPGEGGYYRIEAPGPFDGDSCRLWPTVKPVEVPV